MVIVLYCLYKLHCTHDECQHTLYLRLSDEAGVSGLWEKTDLRVGKVSYTWVSFPLPLMRMKLRQNSYRPAEKVLLSPWHHSSKIFRLLKESQLQHVLAYKVTAVGRESLGAIWAGGLANGQRVCVREEEGWIHAGVCFAQAHKVCRVCRGAFSVTVVCVWSVTLRHFVSKAWTGSWLEAVSCGWIMHRAHKHTRLARNRQWQSERSPVSGHGYSTMCRRCAKREVTCQGKGQQCR